MALAWHWLTFHVGCLIGSCWLSRFSQFWGHGCRAATVVQRPLPTSRRCLLWALVRMVWHSPLAVADFARSCPGRAKALRRHCSCYHHHCHRLVWRQAYLSLVWRQAYLSLVWLQAPCCLSRQLA